ncbi:hypothetical protein ACFL43_01685 [Thermodesulfobacteriota bacterium]
MKENILKHTVSNEKNERAGNIARISISLVNELQDDLFKIKKIVSSAEDRISNALEKLNDSTS